MRKSGLVLSFLVLGLATACAEDTSTPSLEFLGQGGSGGTGVGQSNTNAGSTSQQGGTSSAGSQTENMPAQQQVEPIVLQAEDATVGGQYADTTSMPFEGVALYANNDSVSFDITFPAVPGNYRIDVTGASSGPAAATANARLGMRNLGMLSFTGATASVKSLTVMLGAAAQTSQTLTLTVTGDNNTWDLFIDQVEVVLEGGTGGQSGGSSTSSTQPSMVSSTIGAGSEMPVYDSRVYRNLFVEAGHSEAEVDAHVEKIVNQYFSGTDDERIYYEKGSDEAYIYTADTDDVRSEGVSYGMMISVQLDKQAEFDKLWKFAKTYMQHQSGSYTGYFAWQVHTDGSQIDSNPAPDGDEYFAMALLMAAKRWGSGSGIYDYAAEANLILDHMLNHESLTGNAGVPSLINRNSNQIIFTTEGVMAHTNPSYHLPQFYELFGRWAEKDNDRWYQIADTSRQLFKDACHPSTGLAPDYCDFNGNPTGGDHAAFRFDAWRVAMNIALDSYWWNSDSWARDTWVNNYLSFFRSQGLSKYLNQFNLDGTGASGDHSPGLVAMNAVAALIVNDDSAMDVVEEFWNTPPNTGRYRYYDGCLYLLGLLNVSGRYKIIGE